MRIVVRNPPPLPRSLESGPEYPIINGTLPSLADAEFYADDGAPVTDIAACTIEMKPGEPIVAHVTHLVSELEIEAVTQE